MLVSAHTILPISICNKLEKCIEDKNVVIAIVLEPFGMSIVRSGCLLPRNSGSKERYKEVPQTELVYIHLNWKLYHLYSLFRFY